MESIGNRIKEEAKRLEKQRKASEAAEAVKRNITTNAQLAQNAREIKNQGSAK